MRNLIYPLIILFCVISSFSMFGQERPQRNCGSADGFYERLERDKIFRRNYLAIESFTKEYINKLEKEGAEGLRSGVVTIPVVVHVVYQNATENISDAQVQSQIDVLNEDFRRLNADISSVPGAFSPLTADLRIEFALARRDPNCLATTGITRTSTTLTSFSRDANSSNPQLRNPVKFAASGGAPGWPSDEYLNIWVCDLAGSLLGYASFPADLATRPAEDGVVIDYQYFGNTGTATAPFDLGRTATHEVGHWLNLRHIWGDDDYAGSPVADCDGTDYVDDTPNQRARRTGCPAFPQVSCSNGPNGDMFMNYMDYVNDDCMVMFTLGQAQRTWATLFGVRSSIVGSDGLVPPAEAPSPDLWAQDTPDDTGLEPNASALPMYESVDIWVRNTNDGIVNQEHQNPVYRASLAPNYIYVRVRNRGCSGPQSGTLRLYWAKASTGLSWPSPWDGSVASPALMGNPVGSQAVTVDGGEYTILEFPWVAPNPADYAAIFGGDAAHFCLLARIETAAAAPFGMAFAETANLYQNVQRNNNIVWKNISVATESDGGGRLMASVTMANFSPKTILSELVFFVPRGRGERSLFRHGKVTVNLGKSLFKRWEQGGRVGKGVEIIGDNLIRLAGPGASLRNLKLGRKEVHGIEVIFEPWNNPGITEVFRLNLNQLNQKTGEVIGGEGFLFKTLAPVKPEQGGGAHATVICPGNVWHGSEFPVVVLIDMKRSNQLLGSFTGILSWDPRQLELAGHADLLSGFKGGVHIDPKAGQLIFKGSYEPGKGGTSEVFQAIFKATGPAANTIQPVKLSFSSMNAAATYADLLAGALIEGCDIQVEVPNRISGGVDGGVSVNPAGKPETFPKDVQLPDQESLRGELSLEAYPNPFSESVNLNCHLPSDGMLRISIIDASGRLVRHFFAGQLTAGDHPFSWDGRDNGGVTVPRGLYLLRAEVDGVAAVRKVVKMVGGE